MTKQKIKSIIDKAVPFEGSDESWKHHYPNNWKEKKKEYLKEVKRRHNNINFSV